MNDQIREKIWQFWYERERKTIYAIDLIWFYELIWISALIVLTMSKALLKVMPE